MRPKGSALFTERTMHCKCDKGETPRTFDTPLDPLADEGGGEPHEPEGLPDQALPPCNCKRTDPPCPRDPSVTGAQDSGRSR